MSGNHRVPMDALKGQQFFQLLTEMGGFVPHQFCTDLYIEVGPLQLNVVYHRSSNLSAVLGQTQLFIFLQHDGEGTAVLENWQIPAKGRQFAQEK